MPVCVRLANNSYDDDDEDGTLDRLDPDEDTPGEDDLIKVDFLFSVPLCEGLYNEGYVVIRRENANIKLWWEDDKGAQEFVFDSAGGLEKVYDMGDSEDSEEFEDFCYEENYLWIEGYTASSALKDTGLTVIYRDPCGVDVCVDDVNITVVEADLDVMKINHNAANGELDEADETDPEAGAFVPLNNDDDDYDASNSADKDQSGAINGESDLLEIKLHKVVPAVTDSKYTLTIPSNVRIWTNNDRSGAVVSETTEFDANVDKTLYVEGYSVGSGHIKINWKNGTPTCNDWDRIKVTVFEWLGPLNVPGYAVYQYKVDSPPTGSSQWITPVSGTIKTGSGTSDVTILWGSGPVVGKAVYQANANYIWDLEVNVVRIKFKSTGNTAWYADPATQGPVQVGGSGNALIKSSSATYCMTAEIIVESVDGPTLGGTQRGRKFMEIGHIHQIQLDGKHGLYNDSTPKKRRRSSLEDGDVHWDAGSASTLPWTFTDAQHYLNITTDTQVVSDHKFETFDNPSIRCVDAPSFTMGGDQVDVLKPIASHWLYIAVRAKGPNINGSADVLTQRASLDWLTDATGTVDGAGAYSFTGSGVSGDSQYTEVTNGTKVPDAQANYNEALASQTWITEDQ